MAKSTRKDKKPTKARMKRLLDAHTELQKIRATQQNEEKNAELAEIFSDQLMKLNERIVEEAKQYFNNPSPGKEAGKNG